MDENFIEFKRFSSLNLDAIICAHIYRGFSVMFNRAGDLNSEAQIKTFQYLLMQVPFTSTITLNNDFDALKHFSRKSAVELQGIVNDCYYWTFTMLLHIKGHLVNPKREDYEYPSVRDFIHECYTICAKELFKQANLFSLKYEPQVQIIYQKEIQTQISNSINNYIMTSVTSFIDGYIEKINQLKEINPVHPEPIEVVSDVIDTRDTRDVIPLALSQENIDRLQDELPSINIKSTLKYFTHTRKRSVDESIAITSIGNHDMIKDSASMDEDNSTVDEDNSAVDDDNSTVDEDNLREIIVEDQNTVCGSEVTVTNESSSDGLTELKRMLDQSLIDKGSESSEISKSSVSKQSMKSSKLKKNSESYLQFLKYAKSNFSGADVIHIA
jgi:hypothetical protein